ncbi:NAD(P)/FAD-dependent oxidoreductase [Lentilactobacillus raoultii]|uniref:NAD(P)/FAD-dependent oxidoreductase n=1 Tax=Lentilactobacillus raoultii TaxID=1987503 RepID=A0ABW3PN07_9LACO|nr:FAD-dependent oxidoreductase [Lentilactobacillus raoultii]
MRKRVAVIGGGIIGATAAFYLSYLDRSQSLTIKLFDDDLGQATKAASGIISPWLSKRRNKRWYALAKLGAAFYPKLVMDAQLNQRVYQQTGTIVTRRNPDDLKQLFQEATIKLERTPAMKSVQLLSASEVGQRLPFLTNPPAGVFVTGGAKVDGRQLIQTLLKQAKRRRVIVNHQRVFFDNSGQIRTANGLEQFDVVIVATGAWMKDTLRPLDYLVKIRPQKGQLIDLAVNSWHYGRQLPVLMPESRSDIIPFDQHKLVVGATHENEGGFDLSPTNEARLMLLKNAQLFDHRLKENQIKRVRVGTRGYTEDFAPFFGHLPDHPNILLGGGLGSSGLTTGPIIGYLLAKAIAEQRFENWDTYTKPVSHYII